MRTRLLSLPPETQRGILRKLKDNEILDLLEGLDPDDVTDLLQNVGRRRSKRLIEKLGNKIRKKVEYLMSFNPRSAAGIMSLDYVTVDADDNFGKLRESLKKHEIRTGKLPAVLVTKENYLVGEIRGKDLFHSPNKIIRKYSTKVPHIHYNANEKEVLKLFKDNAHDKVVVLDDDDKILGVIYSDDALRVLQRKPAKSLSDFAGVSEEDILAPFYEKVRRRWWWLTINLGTAFLASWVVGLFQNTIQAFVLLAVYMPVVAGMGGNAATQTLAVMVRGMTLGEVNKKLAWKIVRQEIMAGIINGAIIGLVSGLVALLINGKSILGLVLFLSMVINLAIAGFFGAVIPMLMKALGKDPATSASIFITTMTDIVGFFAFLELATILL